MSSLSHAVSFEYRRAECCLHVSHQLRHQRRAARADETKLLRALWPLAFGPGKQHLMNRRHGRVPRRALLSDRGPERERIEFWRDDHCSASRKCGQRRSYQTMNMKKRHDAERHIFLIQFISMGDVTSRR